MDQQPDPRPQTPADAPNPDAPGPDAPHPDAPRADPPLRIGHGYDLHRLEPLPPAGGGNPLMLGGVAIPADGGEPRGPVAHSDGDALLHAVTDALLAAAALPDIGQLFPNDDPSNADRPSLDFLAEACRLVRSGGWHIANVDATVLLQSPRLSQHKHAIRARLADLLGLPHARVNVKGKSGEHVGPVGHGQAVEVHCVVLLYRRG